MTERLTIGTRRIPNGYDFRRGDGQRFFMVAQGDRGNAVLFAGRSLDKPPSEGIVEFDASVQDKVAAAKRWMRAYPDRHSPTAAYTTFPNTEGLVQQWFEDGYRPLTAATRVRIP